MIAQSRVPAAKRRRMTAALWSNARHEIRTRGSPRVCFASMRLPDQGGGIAQFTRVPATRTRAPRPNPFSPRRQYTADPPGGKAAAFAVDMSAAARRFARPVALPSEGVRGVMGLTTSSGVFRYNAPHLGPTY